MPSRTGLLVRIFVLLLLAVVTVAPMGCLGCGSDGDAADSRDQFAAHFPKDVNEAYYTDDPFVPLGADGYAPSIGATSSSSIEPVEITLPVEADDGVRFASRDGFAVLLRSLDDLERAELSDGVITYNHEGGGQVWTAKEGGYDVSLFSKPGFVEQEGYTWRWEIVGARARPDGDDVLVMDDRGASRLRVTLVKNGSSEHIDTQLRLTGKELALDVPKGPSAVLLRMRVKAVETSEGDDATVPKQNAVNGTPCTLGSECDSTFCVDGVCCDNACTGTCSACSAMLKGQGVDGVCGPIKANTDPQNECPAGACYGNGTCRRDNGQPCASATECMSSVCADNVCCDLACTGICMACTTTLKGQGADGSCGPIMSGLDPNNECAGGSCDGMAACRLDNGESCTTGGQCVSGNCVDGVCCDTTCTNTCKACNLPGNLGTCSNVPQNQNDPVTCAAASESCDGNGFCKLANGENCTQGLECISGFCVDGVCCNSACTTVCSSCAVTGNVGSCSPIALGNDDFFPPNACVGADRQCNGAGACKRFNGTQCASGTDCVSNFCVDGVCCSTSTCANCQSCNVSGNEGTCRNLAMNDTDPNAVPACTGTTACDGSGACKKINGVACTNGDGTQCISGFCVDGVCCNSACSGTCQACSTTKKGSGANGECGDVANGTDPDAECGAQPASTCGNTGICSSGACQQHPSGSICVAAYCSPDGLTQFNADTCNGGGACIDAGSKPCAPYICSSNACLAACSSQSHCNVAAYCDGATSTCVYKKAQGSACAAGVECQSGHCVDGVCCDADCAGTCKVCNASGTCVNVAAGTQDNTCQAQGQACDGSGICKKSIGQSCTVSTECLSNFCVDGFCCNTNCAAACQACSDAKKGTPGQMKDGICENVVAGTDPNNDCAPEAVTTCGNNGFCDGMGQCQKYDNTKVCAPPACIDSDTLKGPNLCDGVGFCAMGETECAPYACKNNACKMTCASNSDCVTDAYCDMQVCLPKKPDGQACASGGQCQSGQCVDGVCCASAACADCQACNLAGNGTCTPVAAGQKDGMCSGPDKACDGAGNCKKINGQSCAAPADCVTDNCVDGVCCNVACKTTCQSCNVAGNVGVCSNVVSGQDDGTCTGSDVACDGQGECKKELGQTCSAAAECLVGKCVDGVCCNEDCTETCKACNLQGTLGLCSFVPENGKDEGNCNTPTLSCNGSGDCVKSLGEACTTGAECASKHCTDGVCCNIECGIDCQSCNVPGSVGTCSDVPENQQDGACIDGKACNGAGKCMVELGKKCGVGTQCLSGFCFDQVCCDAECGGDCQACSVAAGATADGTCSPLTGTTCDDGNLCTQTDVCQAGTCSGSEPVVCEAPGTCQNEGVCNPTTGICEYSDQGPECTDGKNPTGGGCACSAAGDSSSRRRNLAWFIGALALAAVRRRQSTCSKSARTA